MLILGYGNPGRRDDGLGPAFAERVASLTWPDVETDADYQLTVEDGATLAEHGTVLFVDAACEGPEPFAFDRIGPSDEITFTTHSVSPGAVLAIAEEHFGGAPEAWILAIRGYEFDFREGLTPGAQSNFEEAFEFVQTWVRARRESSNGQDNSHD